VIDEVEIESAAPTEDVIALDEALTNLTNQTDYPSRCYLLDGRAGLTLLDQRLKQTVLAMAAWVIHQCWSALRRPGCILSFDDLD
jgi:hypothetical protein